MPTNIQGFEVLTKPASTEIESFPIFITIPANTLRVVTFPTEFNSIAISLQIENQDGANAASYRLNSSTDPLVNLPASNFATVDNTVVNYLTVIAGAADTVLVEAQVLPASRTEIPIEVQV